MGSLKKVGQVIILHTYSDKAMYHSVYTNGTGTIDTIYLDGKREKVPFAIDPTQVKSFINFLKTNK